MATRCSLSFDERINRALSFRIYQHLPEWFPLDVDICKLTEEDLVKDGICTSIPAAELEHCHNVGEFRTVVSRHRLSPAGSS